MSKPLSVDQKVFNKVARHLLRQNERSLRDYRGNGGMSCAYRGDNGKRCAIGALITNTEYRSYMESQSAEGDDVEPVLKKKGYNIKLCVDLQLVHDACEPKNWKKALADIANRRGLKMPKI